MESVPEQNESIETVENKSSKPQRKWLRRLLRGFVWTLVGILMLPVMILFLWKFQPFRDVVRDVGFSVASSFLDGRLEGGRISGDLFTCIQISDLRWKDREGQPLVEFKRLEVCYDLPHFFKTGELLIEKVLLLKPKARLVKGKRGGLNLVEHLKLGKPTAKPKPQPKAKGPGFQMRVQNLIIRDLTLDWNMGVAMKFRKGYIRGFFALRGDTLEYESQQLELLSKLLFLPNSKEFPVTRGQFLFRLRGPSMAVKHFRFDFGKRSKIRMDATIKSLADLALRAKIYRLFVARPDLKAIIPAVPIHTDTSLTLSAKGSKRTMDLDLRVDAGKAKLTVKGKAGLEKETFDVRIKARAVNLKRLLGMKDLRSNLGLTLTAKGKGFSARTDASVDLTIEPGFFQDYRFRRSSSKIVLKGGFAKLRNLKLKTPYLWIKGRLDANIPTGYLDARLAGGSNDLSRIGRVIKQKMRGSIRFSLTAKAKRGWLPAVDLKQLVIRRFRHPAARLSYLSLKAKVPSLTPVKATLALRTRGIRAGGQRIKRLNLDLRYKMENGGHEAWIRRFDVGMGPLLFRKPGRRPIWLHFANNKAEIKRFWLRHQKRGESPQELRIDGSFQVQGRGQDLTVRASGLNIASLQEALHLMPKTKLGGVVHTTLRFQGNFERPRISLGLTMRDGRYDVYDQLDLDVKLRYPQRRRYVSLEVDLLRRKQEILGAWVEVPARLSLRHFSPMPILMNRELRVGLWLGASSRDARLALDRKTTPESLRQMFKAKDGLYVDWIGKALKLPFGGRAKLALAIKGPLRRPKLYLHFLADRARWKREIQNIDMGVSLSYNGKELILHGERDHRGNFVTLHGKRLIEFFGRLPLTARMWKRRGRLQTKVVLRDEPLLFELNLLEQRLSRLFQMLPRKVHAQAAFVKGLLAMKMRLSGKPRRPLFDLDLRFKKGSICPMTPYGFVCEQGRSILVEEYLKQQGFGQRSKSRRTSLRVKGIHFSTNLKYRPSASKLRSGQVLKLGRLFLTSRLQIPSQKPRKSSNSKRVNRLLREANRAEHPVDFVIKDSWVSVEVVLNPTTFVPKYKLHTPLKLDMMLKDLSVTWLHKYLLRLPAFETLQGRLGLDLKVDKTLDDPNIAMELKFEKGAYLWERTAGGREAYIEGLGQIVRVHLLQRKANVRLLTKVMGQVLVDAKADMGLRVGFLPKNNKVIYKPSSFFRGVLKIPGFSFTKLHRLGGVFNKVSGEMRAALKLEGDPACPRFQQVSLGKNGKQDSFLQLRNFVLGKLPKKGETERSPGAMLTRNGRRSSSSRARLMLQDVRLDFSTTDDGRSKVKVEVVRELLWRKRRGKWIKRRSLQRLLTGAAALWLPLGPLASSTMSLAAAKKHCPGWGRATITTKSGAKKQVAVPSEQVDINLYSPGIPLDFVEAFVPELEMSALLMLTAKLKGKLSDLEVSKSQIGLRINRLAYPSYGVDIRSLCRRIKRKLRGRNVSIPVCKYSFLFLSINKKGYRLDSRLQGLKGEPLTIKGNIGRKGFFPTSLKIAIRSKTFQPMATLRYKLMMDTKIDVSGDLQNPRIVGEIRIPQMLFTLPESSRKPGDFAQDKDIIVLGEKSETRLKKELQRRGKAGQGKAKTKSRKHKKKGSLYVDLKIKIPRNFRVKNRDIDVEAKTDDFRNLRVLLERGVLTLTGGVEIVRGDIALYGKKFQVRAGSEVQFTGQSLSLSQVGSIDPRLDIVAVYNVQVQAGTSLARRGFKRVLVLLKIGGSARQPKIDFEVKDAGTSQTITLNRLNVLSLILTGTTTEDLNSAQRQNLTSQAVGALGQLVASEIRDVLSGYIRLDVFKIDLGARVEDIKIALGWYWTPDLYFEFNYKPLPLEEETWWEARLDYAISRSLSLELRSGQMNRNDTLLFQGSGHVYYRFKR